MPLTERVREILSWYPSDTPGTKANLARMLMAGTLSGTGKMVILPVDQGFEHGPQRSFAPNPPGYDPEYHVTLAIESGCNAYAAPLGFLEAVAGKFAADIPFILKLNNSDSLSKMEPASALTGSPKDALRLGCAAVGFTIYPGSAERNVTLEQLREVIAQAKELSLPTVVWAYPRGSGVAKEAEQAVDVVAYGAQMAAQMGAHIIKVKPPKENIAQAEAKAVFEKYSLPTKTLAERVRLVVQACFAGHRVVIFSGGEAKDTAAVLEEIRGIKEGGGFGSIMGRNAFQRPKAEAIKLLKDVMAIHAGK